MSHTPTCVQIPCNYILRLEGTCCLRGFSVFVRPSHDQQKELPVLQLMEGDEVYTGGKKRQGKNLDIVCIHPSMQDQAHISLDYNILFPSSVIEFQTSEAVEK